MFSRGPSRQWIKKLFELPVIKLRRWKGRENKMSYPIIPGEVYAGCIEENTHGVYRHCCCCWCFSFFFCILFFLFFFIFIQNVKAPLNENPLDVRATLRFQYHRRRLSINLGQPFRLLFEHVFFFRPPYSSPFFSRTNKIVLLVSLFFYLFFITHCVFSKFEVLKCYAHPVVGQNPNPTKYEYFPWSNFMIDNDRCYTFFWGVGGDCNT